MTVRCFDTSSHFDYTSTPSSLLKRKQKEPILPSKNFGVSSCPDITSTNTEKQTKSRSTDKKKKYASFRKRLSYRYVISLDQYTEEEIDACWFSREELRTIRTDVKFAVDRLTNGNLDDSAEQYCQRGLECQTPLAALKRNRLRIATREVVLDEQDIQYNQYGYVIDPFLIAAACQLISKSASENARSIALKDELDAMK